VATLTFGSSRGLTIGTSIDGMTDGRGRSEVAIKAALEALSRRRADQVDDPLFPVAVLRGDALLGSDADAAGLLASWAPGVTSEVGSVRYRWRMDPRFVLDWPAWIGPRASWRPWRPRDAAAWADRKQRSSEDVERLLTPLILADSLQLLVEESERTDPTGDRARDFLDETLPRARRDAAPGLGRAPLPTGDRGRPAGTGDQSRTSP
jgi:hypothetical protein